MMIYLVRNKINDKVYIGKTTKSLDERKQVHLYDANEGSQLHFHNALRKHGLISFDWQSIDQAETEQELNEKEKYWIQFYKSFDPVFGYNLTLGGEGGPKTFETRQKMREAHKGHIHSVETRQRIGAGNRGKRRTAQQRKAQSERMLGKVRPKANMGKEK